MPQQNNNQDLFANAAQNLYGDQRKKEQEEKSLRNSLLNELGDNLTPAQTLYSSNEELKKMRDEMNAKKIQQRTQNNFKGNFLGAAASIDESQNPLQVPLPENKIQQTPSVKNNDTKEPQVDLTHKPKLLDKIPTKKEQKSNHTLRQEENRDVYGLEYATGEEVYETEPIKAGIDFNIDKGELEAENDVPNNNQNENITSNGQEDSAVTDNNERFNKFMKRLYVAEGGFVDDPDDRGGRTNKGVTQRAFDAYNKKNGLPLKDVKDITTEEATEFYRKEYWIASGADKIKDKNLAYMHFDAAVNHGVGRAKKLLEQSGEDFNKYYQDRKSFYDEIVKNRPSQQKYYKGWMNRINNIEKMRRENALN